MILLGIGLSCETRADGFLDVLKTIHPYAAVGMSYESNLLLRPDSERSDHYYTLAAGFDTNLEAGLQQFHLDGRIYHNDYHRFNDLDYTGGEANVVWDWIAGRLWSGRFGYGFEQTLRSFAYQLIPEKDILTRNRVFLEADRWVADRWRVGLLADWTDVGFTESTTQDRQVTRGGFIVDYVTPTGNSVGLKTTYSQGRFENNADEDYAQTEIGPTATWRFSPKTRLQASAGYSGRTYDNISGQDYSGAVGRLSALWKPTGKTSIELSVFRTLSAMGDEIANYAVVDGVTLEPTWNIYDKTTLRAVASYEQQDYQGEPNVIVADNLDDRVDDVTDFEFWLDWNPRQTIKFSVGYVAEQRNSTEAIRDYNNQGFFGQLQVGL